jgi:hypothetical protein
LRADIERRARDCESTLFDAVARRWIVAPPAPL